MPKGKILMGKAPGKKEMNRTSGTAKRLTGRSEGIATKLKYGAPLTGSASGVKSISLKDAGEVLTQGIFSASRKGLKMDPAGLAMALPVGKLVKAAQVLRTAGKLGKAAALEARVGAKTAGKIFGGSERGLPMERSLDVGGRARAASEKMFPRLPNKNIPGSERTFDIYADPLGEGASRFQGGVVRKASGAYGEATMPRVGSKLPKPKVPNPAYSKDANVVRAEADRILKEAEGMKRIPAARAKQKAYNLITRAKNLKNRGK